MTSQPKLRFDRYAPNPRYAKHAEEFGRIVAIYQVRCYVCWLPSLIMIDNVVAANNALVNGGWVNRYEFGWFCPDCLAKESEAAHA